MCILHADSDFFDSILDLGWFKASRNKNLGYCILFFLAGSRRL